MGSLHLTFYDVSRAYYSAYYLNGFDEITGDWQRNVSLKQRDAHLAQGRFDIIFGQRTLLGELVEHTG